MERNGVYKVMKIDDTLQKRVTSKQLRYYLAEFYVTPTKSEEMRSQALKDASSKAPVGYIFRNRQELYQYAQALILSYGKRINWKCINSYEIVELYIQGEPVVTDLSRYDLLFITYGFNEIPNRQLHNITNNILSSRAAYGKKSVVLSLKPSSDFCVSLKTFYSTVNTSGVL